MHYLTTVLCVMSERCIMRETCNFMRKHMHYLRKTKGTTLYCNMWWIMKLFTFEDADSIITQLEYVYEFGPHHTGSSYSAV